MESKPSENEKVTPDDSQETDKAVSDVEQRTGKSEPTPAAKDGEPDFDVRPADTYLGPDYDPKKSSSPMTLWLAVIMVAAVIGLTYYAFRSQAVPEQGSEPAGGQTAAPLTAASSSEPQLPALPEKAPDAADFSPTPETEAAAAAPASLPATASSSSPTTPAGEVAAPPAADKTTDSAKTGSAKTSATTLKNAETKPSPAKSAAATSKKPADPKPTAATSKSADPKPATAASKSADPKPATAASKPADPKPAATASKPTTAEPKGSEAASPVGGATKKAATETKVDEAKPEGPKPDATTAMATTPTDPAVGAGAAPTVSGSADPASGRPATTAAEISNLWVVNISSTPDASESLRLLNRVIATDVGGQVYFYETTIDGRVHHRIRVGFFKSRDEAEAVGQKVKESFQLSATPWAVKPTVEEVEKYRK